jgi:hypothetical protein
MFSLIKSLCGFVFFKGIVFFSVLLYSYLGFTAEYIQLEQNIAIAMMITPLIVFGLTTSFAHYKITKKTSELDGVYWQHLKYVTAILVALSILFLVFNWKNQTIIILLTFFVFSRLYSQKFKIENNVYYSSFIDSLPYIFISLCLILVFLSVDIDDGMNLVFYILVVLLFYWFYKKSSDFKYIKNNSSEVISFYAFGAKAFLASAIIVAVMMIPRAFADLIVPEQDVEDFLLSLRFASIGVLIYQFISIKYFSAIYKMENKHILVFSIAIYIASFVSVMTGLYVLTYVDIITTAKYNVIASLLTSIWITSAFLEYFVAKNNGVNFFVKTYIFLFTILCISGYFITDTKLNLSFVSVSLAMVIISQIISIFRNKPVYIFISISIFCSLLIIGVSYV